MGRNQGIQSKNKVRVDQRLGSGAKAINHAGVAQIGQRQGNHSTNRPATSYGGVDLFSAGPGFNKAKYGNEIAAQTVAAPGGSRNIHPAGSQCKTGDGGPALKSQDPMSAWKR